jgi:hypothetical protein
MTMLRPSMHWRACIRAMDLDRLFWQKSAATVTVFGHQPDDRMPVLALLRPAHGYG